MEKVVDPTAIKRTRLFSPKKIESEVNKSIRLPFPLPTHLVIDYFTLNNKPNFHLVKFSSLEMLCKRNENARRVVNLPKMMQESRWIFSSHSPITTTALEQNEAANKLSSHLSTTMFE